jgi:predicted nuclease with RNAse H fold
LEDEQRNVPISPIEDSVTVSLIDACSTHNRRGRFQRLDALLARISLRSLPVDDRNYFSVSRRSMRLPVARTVLARCSRNSTPK